MEQGVKSKKHWKKNPIGSKNILGGSGEYWNSVANKSEQLFRQLKNRKNRPIKKSLFNRGG